MMKKFLFFLILTALFSIAHAQQEEYTAYLEQALEAVYNKDEHGYTTNMKYFSTAIEKEKITPEILTRENFELYSQCLLAAMKVGYISLENFDPDNIAFLEYDIENHPNNMILLGYVYYSGTFNIPQDFDKAIYWYGKSLESGNEYAIYGLNAICLPNRFGANNHCEEVVSVLKKSAEKGVPVAMAGLADYYFNKYQEYEKGIEWYEKAFAAGNTYQKATIAEKMSAAYSIYSPVYSRKKSKQWKAESISLFEQYVADFEKNDTPDPQNIEYGKYTMTLRKLVVTYKLGIKDKKKAKFYSEKGCKNGMKDFCEGYKYEPSSTDINITKDTNILDVIGRTVEEPTE